MTCMKWSSTAQHRRLTSQQVPSLSSQTGQRTEKEGLDQRCLQRYFSAPFPCFCCQSQSLFRFRNQQGKGRGKNEKERERERQQRKKEREQREEMQRVDIHIAQSPVKTSCSSLENHYCIMMKQAYHAFLCSLIQCTKWL